ncbi:MAG: tetratricopeptide (TPR) repeat protein [Crocinitomix sp.]|jgi:tetratricopeptide (TPR) repeat protein
MVLIAASCSTEKDALINKGYHNMNARYNGYYNAGVIIDEMLEGYREGYLEDYIDVIPLDLYPTELDAPNVYPELEDAIERCSKVIVRHSMPNPELVKKKSNENCRWIDDNWLVVGQAYYIKREYKEAREKLQYISESDFYRGEESVYEARIWLAKTHIAMGEFPQAKRVLKMVEQSIKTTEAKKENKEKKKKPSKLEKQRAKKAGKKEKDKKPAEFPKRLKVDYEIAMADLYLAQDENKKAIEHLENAIEIGKDKKRRARHMFALGQLYAEQGNNEQASKYFAKVTRSNAPYEMRFKAKIKNALTSTGNTEELVVELNKMLKDGKNIEYKDQIYYALAELDMKQKDVVSAKSNYTNSVLWSIKNNRQKGLSYLRLADIHFEERDYLSAQKYYDSCVQALPEDYDGYEMLKNKALGLADLVYNYELVEFEDSVQRIAIMSPKEREKFLKKTIKDIEAQKERKRLEEEQRLLAQQARINNQQGGGGNGVKKGKGYFSNPKLIASGFNDFRGLWGQRELEDNWRRTNKNSFNDLVDEDGELIDSVVVDELTVDMLLLDIPLTQPALDSSNLRILNSLYSLGIIYKEQLKEENEAMDYFQAVLDRNIQHPKVLPALYQLYLINKKNGSAKANGYKSTILKEHGESEIAQILQDPDYLKKKELKDREELNEYSGVMRNYRRRSYGVVISKCNDVITNDSENKFLEKYYLLKAFAVSKVSPGNKDAISDPLTKLYQLSPDSEEGIQAKIYLDQIKGGAAIVAPDPGVKSPYKYDPDSKHFFMLVVPADKGDVAESKIKISNFNGVFFKNDGLSMQDAPLGDTHQILVVRSFKDLTRAEAYINSFRSEKAKETIKSMATDYEICLINTKNFSELFKAKDIEQYLEFYKANY